jgi:hypothetical protein
MQPWWSTNACTRFKHLLVVACLMVVSAAPYPLHAAEQPADLVALMSLLSRVERVEVDYRETVTSDLIATAISQNGTLTYQAPDHLERVTDKGKGFVLDGQQIRLLNDGAVVRDLDVADLPPLQALVGALRAIFAGDLETLHETYRLDYQPFADHWELDLQPIAVGLQMVFRRLHLIGTGATVTTIETTEANGDTRNMYMTLRRRVPAVIQ